MQQYLNRGLQILILMSAGVMSSFAADKPNPPTYAERDDVQKRLDKAKGSHEAKRVEVEKTTAMLDNLGKSIDALEKTLEPLAKVTDDEDIRKEADKMRETLTKLKSIRTKTQTDLDKGRTNANALQRELQTTLKEYFSKADPKMIANNFGVPFDGVDFAGTPLYRELTSGDPLAPRHYALGAEHTWDDRVWWSDKGGWKSVNMKAISQHEMVTTRDVYDMAERLVKKQTPGAQIPVARAGLMVNQSHLKKHPEAYQHIFGNKSFTPSVINNSTGSQIDLEKPELFRELLDLYTRGEGTRTFKVDGTQVTYGLPAIGMPILCNSAGNSHWHAKPDFNAVKSFFPHRLNIGSTAIPAIDDNTNRRNDKAPSEIEDYSSGCSVDALIQRPRWNKDGTPVKTQYVSPNIAQ
jgi:hypothetical protein